MKTFNFPIKDLFNKGLRPLEESPRNGNYLTAVSNGRVTEGGLVGADKYTRAFALNERAQVFSSYKGIFVLTEDTLYKAINGALSQVATGLPIGGLWSCADFGNFLVFTNGEVNLVKNPTSDVFIS